MSSSDGVRARVAPWDKTIICEGMPPQIMAHMGLPPLRITPPCIQTGSAELVETVEKGGRCAAQGYTSPTPNTVSPTPTSTLRIDIPPCIANSAVGERLAARIMADTWVFLRGSEVADEWKQESPTNHKLKHERRLGERARPLRICYVCAKKGHKKCSRCLQVYYCSAMCQQLHWERHSTECKPAESSLREYLAIAVPDYRCFWQYQNSLCLFQESLIKDKPRCDVVNVCIISREQFDSMYGASATLRTCVNLAVNGRPCKHLIKILGN